MPRLKPEVLIQRKEHILQAALVCFARKGYHETTMNEIVAQAGLSKGGVYVHFDSKQALFQALLRWSVAQFSFPSDTEVSGDDPYERLSAFVDGLMATVTSAHSRDTIPLTLEMWALNANNPEVKQTATELYDEFRRPLSALIQDGIDQAIFHPIDPRTVANILIAIPEGLMVQAMIDEDAVDWQAVSVALKRLIDGLLANGSRHA